VVEAYIKECLREKKKSKKGKKQQEEEIAATKIQSRLRQNKAKQVAAEKKKNSNPASANDPLSPSVLFDILAVDTATRFARLVTPLVLKRLYEGTQIDGLTDEFLQFFSAGSVIARLPAEEVEQMAAGFARVKNDRLGREEFEAFMEKLAEALGIDVAMLVRAFRQTEEGRHPGGEELVKKFFAARRKNYKYGSTFKNSDWMVICRTCEWLSVSTGCNQGDAGQVFSLVYREGEKATKDKKGPDANTIWRNSSFAALVEGMARRLGRPPLQVICDLWRAAKLYEDGAIAPVSRPLVAEAA
jgi:hypothetical protein